MTPRNHPNRFRALALALLSPWCGCAEGEGTLDEGLGSLDDDGGQTGAEVEPVSCEVPEPIQVTLDDASELGFAARDVLDALGTPRTGSWQWDDGTASPATLSASFSGQVARVVRYAPLEAPPAREIAVDCSPVMFLPLTLELATDDGSLDETWQLELRASGPDRADATLPVDLRALEGSYLPTTLELRSGESLLTFWQLDVAQGELSLVLDAHVESAPRTDGADAIRSVRVQTLGRFVP